MKLTSPQCVAAFKAQPVEMQRWIITILAELESAREQHPGGVWKKTAKGEKAPDPIHAAAVLAEEAGEVVQAALKYKYEKGQYYKIHKEAVQTGAMALRLLLALPELPWPKKN